MCAQKGNRQARARPATHCTPRLVVRMDAELQPPARAKDEQLFSVVHTASDYSRMPVIGWAGTPLVQSGPRCRLTPYWREFRASTWRCSALRHAFRESG